MWARLVTYSHAVILFDTDLHNLVLFCKIVYYSCTVELYTVSCSFSPIFLSMLTLFFCWLSPLLAGSRRLKLQPMWVGLLYSRVSLFFSNAHVKKKMALLCKVYIYPVKVRASSMFLLSWCGFILYEHSWLSSLIKTFTKQQERKMLLWKNKSVFDLFLWLPYVINLHWFIFYHTFLGGFCAVSLFLSNERVISVYFLISLPLFIKSGFFLWSSQRLSCSLAAVFLPW